MCFFHAHSSRMLAGWYLWRKAVGEIIIKIEVKLRKNLGKLFFLQPLKGQSPVPLQIPPWMFGSLDRLGFCPNFSIKDLGKWPHAYFWIPHCSYFYAIYKQYIIILCSLSRIMTCHTERRRVVKVWHLTSKHANGLHSRRKSSHAHYFSWAQR